MLHSSTSSSSALTLPLPNSVNSRAPHNVIVKITQEAPPSKCASSACQGVIFWNCRIPSLPSQSVGDCCHRGLHQINTCKGNKRETPSQLAPFFYSLPCFPFLCEHSGAGARDKERGREREREREKEREREREAKKRRKGKEERDRGQYLHPLAHIVRFLTP